MKNRVLIAFSIALIISSCNQTGRKPDSGSMSKRTFSTGNPVPELNTNLSYYDPGNGVFHRIGADTLIYLIRNYITAFPEEALNSGFTGFIGKEYFQDVSGANSGYIFYTAMYPGAFTKEIYLAFDTGHYAEDFSVSCELPKEYYLRSAYPGTINDTSLSGAELLQYIADIPPPEGVQSVYVTKDVLDENATLFLSNFLVNNQPANSRICGLFRKDEFNALLDQEGCTGVRFFLGYDPERSDDKIRVVLVGVNSAGNVLLVNPGTSEEAVYLENGLPPQ